MPQLQPTVTPQDLPLILIVEDDPRMRALLRSVLRGNGFRTLEADNLKDGLEIAVNALPQFIFVDLGLPDGNGTDLIRRVREWSSIPIFVLSGHDRLQEKVAGLNAGADDYLTKPFVPDELLARVRAALRRMAARDRPVATASFETGELRVDLIRRIVTVQGQRVYLTPTEYRLLVVLVRQAGCVVTHERLLSEVWGPSKAEFIHYTHIYMTHLRRKLEPDPMNPVYLLTETGIGYRLSMG
jgi:two-component system KDP operon response regulator KdpE